MAEFEPVLLRRSLKKASPSLDAYRGDGGYRALHNLFGFSPVVGGGSIGLSGRLPQNFRNVFDMFGDCCLRIGAGKNSRLQRKQLTRQRIPAAIVNHARFLDL